MTDKLFDEALISLRIAIKKFYAITDRLPDKAFLEENQPNYDIQYSKAFHGLRDARAGLEELNKISHILEQHLEDEPNT